MDVGKSLNSKVEKFWGHRTVKENGTDQSDGQEIAESGSVQRELKQSIRSLTFLFVITYQPVMSKPSLRLSSG